MKENKFNLLFESLMKQLISEADEEIDKNIDAANQEEGIKDQDKLDANGEDKQEIENDEKTPEEIETANRIKKMKLLLAKFIERLNADGIETEDIDETRVKLFPKPGLRNIGEEEDNIKLTVLYLYNHLDIYDNFLKNLSIEQENDSDDFVVIDINKSLENFDEVESKYKNNIAAAKKQAELLN